MRVLVLLALAAGCAKQTGTYEIAAAPATTVAPDQKVAIRAEADRLWALRGDKAQLQAALVKYQELYAMDPMDRTVGMHLVRGWYFLGDGHETEKEAKLVAYATALDWGKKCIAINAEFKALLEKGDETEETAARVFTKEDVPCVYWSSSSLGRWARGTGLTTLLRHKDTVRMWMTKVTELEPTFYYNGPDRYWGAYYSVLPSYSGQDLKKSKEYFDKAMAGHNAFLGTHVLYATEWAVKMQDKETFKKELQWVLDAPVDALPEVQPEMEAEKRKAQAALTAIDDYFAN